MVRSVFTLLLGLGVPSLITAAPWAVQLGAFETAVEAQGFREEVLQREEKSPVFIHASDGWQRVMVGPFEFTADAFLVREDYRESGYPDAFLQDIKSTGPDYPPPLSNVHEHIAPFFNIHVSNITELPLQTLTGNQIYETLETIDATRPKVEYKAALLDTLPLMDDDPLKGYIHTNLGICEIIEKDYARALGYLLPVGNGTITSAASHRIMAMIRIAWITHWIYKDRLGALRAYRQIEALTASDAVRARCRSEIIGLMMELAESGKGSHAEVREAIGNALRIIPASQVKYRAVIELMNVETYARQMQPDYAMAATLGEAFIAKYESTAEEKVDRELAAALFQTGFYHLRNDNPDRARTLFNKILAEVPHDVEQFAGVNSHAQAFNGLAHIAAEEGSRALKEQILRDIIELYPNTRLTGRIKDVYPFLETDLRPVSTKSNTE